MQLMDKPCVSGPLLKALTKRADYYWSLILYVAVPCATKPDEEGAEEEPVDTVLLHAATLSLSLDNLRTSVGHWHRIIQQQYRRATLKFHPDKGGSQDLFEQLERARDYLKEWAAKWFAAEGNYFAIMGPHCAYIWHTNEPNVGIHMPYVGPMGIDISRTSPAGGTDMRKSMNFQVPSRNRC